MAAIAGMALPNAEEQVHAMLERMAHRGPKGRLVQTNGGVTAGLSWTEAQPNAQQVLKKSNVVEDAVSECQFARAEMAGDSFVLSRDMFGAAPLYYGFTDGGALCFASEVKALVGVVGQVEELPPGSTWKSGKVSSHAGLALREPLEEEPLTLAAEVRRRLAKAVERYANLGHPFGIWLSGGLDSSILTALARPHIATLHTFSAGFENSEDLEHARLVARFTKATHHEYAPTLAEVVKALPQVIYHLESFDTQVVRSALMNYFVARITADYVPAVFSGEGSDELFAGDEDLKSLSLEDLPAELLRRANMLHNTTLQRVDRSAAAFGLVAYLPFLDNEVAEYATYIPAEYKIYNGLEKWILRRAVYDLLPERVLRRQKAKFWEGAGVYRRMIDYAEEKISDDDLQQARQLPGGEKLHSKEALLYYRIFEEHFGKLAEPAWVGFL